MPDIMDLIGKNRCKKSAIINTAIYKPSSIWTEPQGQLIIINIIKHYEAVVWPWNRLDLKRHSGELKLNLVKCNNYWGLRKKLWRNWLVERPRKSGRQQTDPDGTERMKNSGKITKKNIEKNEVLKIYENALANYINARRQYALFFTSLSKIKWLKI